MRISDWSSDVCSSDLLPGIGVLRLVDQYMVRALVELEPHPLAEIAHGEQMAGDADQIVEIGIALLALGERIGLGKTAAQITAGRQFVGDLHRGRGRQQFARDRKSTRLNSSP